MKKFILPGIVVILAQISFVILGFVLFPLHCQGVGLGGGACTPPSSTENIIEWIYNIFAFIASIFIAVKIARTVHHPISWRSGLILGVLPFLIWLVVVRIYIG